MYTNARRSDRDVQELWRAAGDWLRKLREQRALSQRDLAKLVGAEFYRFISQLEMGRGRVPPDRYKLCTNAQGVKPKTFVKTLLRYHDPVTHNIRDDVLNENADRAAG